MKRALSVVFFLLSLIVAAIAIVVLSPFMVDYRTLFCPVALKLLSGQSILYDGADNFINPPWFLGIVIPFATLPFEVGQVLFTASSIFCLLVSIICLRERFPVYAVAMAIINRNTFNLFGVGESDTFILLGIGFGYLAIKRRNVPLLAVAFWLMAIKPQNLVLAGLLYLIETRAWKATLLSFASIIAAGFFIGLDWPLRWFAFIRSNPFSVWEHTSIWRLNLPPALIAVGAILSLGLFLWQWKRERFNERTLSLALAVNIAFSPYTQSAHYVLLTPAFLFLSRYTKLGVPLFLVSCLPVLANRSEFYALYPIAILIASAWWGFQPINQPRQSLSAD